MSKDENGVEGMTGEELTQMLSVHAACACCLAADSKFSLAAEHGKKARAFERELTRRLSLIPLLARECEAWREHMDGHVLAIRPGVHSIMAEAIRGITKARGTGEGAVCRLTRQEMPQRLRSRKAHTSGRSKRTPRVSPPYCGGFRSCAERGTCHSTGLMLHLFRKR